MIGRAVVLALVLAGAAHAAAPRVDINSASVAELKTLPGIGEAEARRIVAARPYPSKAKLVAENVLTMEQFVAVKDRIVAAQKLARPSGEKR